MHLLLSVVMVAAAGVGVVTAAADRRPHPLALAQAVIATGAMLLHAVGLLGAGSLLGTTGLFAVAALLVASALAGLAGARRSSAALTRAVMGIAMAFLLVATSSYDGLDPLGSSGAAAVVDASVSADPTGGTSVTAESTTGTSVTTDPAGSAITAAGTSGVASVTHHSAMASGAGSGSAVIAVLLGAVALATATAVGVRMLRTRRYGSGVECLSMGVCLAGMGAMALV
ncbi:hypothetical protein [Herbiconiux sp. YIM B11900]|uniref:hypothetical protein n=1 Tax=Herbiconiux sp. YIM B11900 TaxID=3404131 RepID=UPI003F87A03F